MESAGGGDADDTEASARLLEAMTLALERLVARNDQIPPDPEPWLEEAAPVAARRARRRGLAPFQGARPPSVSVGEYLERIHRYTACSSSCFVVGFVYIDRAAHRHPASPVVSRNVHRLILTSVLIASKVLDDTGFTHLVKAYRHHNNAFFAKVGGVSNAELNRLELELLFLLDFELTVSLRVFERYCWHLEKEMACIRATNAIEKTILVTAENGDDVQGFFADNLSQRSSSQSGNSKTLDQGFILAFI